MSTIIYDAANLPRREPIVRHSSADTATGTETEAGKETETQTDTAKDRGPSSTVALSDRAKSLLAQAEVGQAVANSLGAYLQAVGASPDPRTLPGGINGDQVDPDDAAAITKVLEALKELS